MVVVPSELFASALTFDLGALGENRAVISAARAAKEDVAAWGGMEDAAVVFVSFDPSEDVAAERDAKVAAAKATAAGRAVVAAAVALAPGGSATRSRDRRGGGGAGGREGAPEAKVGTVRGRERDSARADSAVMKAPACLSFFLSMKTVGFRCGPRRSIGVIGR